LNARELESALRPGADGGVETVASARVSSRLTRTPAHFDTRWLPPQGRGPLLRYGELNADHPPFLVLARLTSDNVIQLDGFLKGTFAAEGRLWEWAETSTTIYEPAP
jgi:hypothetical protein